ncbi:hypothetical protein HED50_13060 [Ochrobactrum oryzae]|nr:hypothetical protein [Brucella oryzae]
MISYKKQFSTILDKDYQVSGDPGTTQLLYCFDDRTHPVIDGNAGRCFHDLKTVAESDRRKLHIGPDHGH